MFDAQKYVIAAGWIGAFMVVPTQAIELSLPVDCTVGQTCYFQQFPDVESGPDVRDPWCGAASYDGHKGTDIRVLSLAEIHSPGVPVIAAADGIVGGVRDNVADKLIETDADRAAVAGIECGNGVVLNHTEAGWVTQYCHLRRESVAVMVGQQVARGDVLGYIGASGFVEFPHVHLSVRHNGIEVDPFTTRKLGEGCGVVDAQTLWRADALAQVDGWTGDVLGSGFAGEIINSDRLVVDGIPVPPQVGSPVLIAWAWMTNLQKGDEISLMLQRSTGEVLARDTLDPLNSNKAVYSAYVGKRFSVTPGRYEMHVQVQRGSKTIIFEEKSLLLE